MNTDVVLITIDALRHDAVSHLPSVLEWFGEERRTEAITSGAATNWVFPSILGGSYYTNAYNKAGTVREDLTTLPDILGENGYATGAFLGFNPYLSKWQDRFDAFWNGGLSNEDAEWYSHPIEKWLSRGYRTALLKKRVSGDDVIGRAREWYETQSTPRFLWIHLMEPHKPYFPGIRAGREVGLIDAYRSIVNLHRFGDDIPERDAAVQRRLYEKCVRRTDELVERALSFVSSDASVLVLGDHGEEFDHAHYGHERLYDECVRVPLFSDGISDIGNRMVRQIDLPAAILRENAIDVPPTWDGQEVNDVADCPAFMLTPQPGVSLLHAGVRTRTDKLIRSFDRGTGELRRTEYYDLEVDPEERQNRSEAVDHGLSEELEEFIKEHEPALEMSAETGIDSETVEARLKNLGYK